GLEDEVLVEAEEVAQREELLLRRVARRVLALGRERKRRLRPEHVAVRAHRAGRRRICRLRRVRMERDIPGTQWQWTFLQAFGVVARMEQSRTPPALRIVRFER